MFFLKKGRITKTGSRGPDGRIDEPDRDGWVTIAGQIFPNNCLYFNENFKMKNHAHNSQEKVPSKDPMQMSQILCTSVNGLVARPEWNSDNHQRQGRCRRY